MAILTYAGIGSRETPSDVLSVMRMIGKALAIEGWMLRSGGAGGADTAFEEGCDYVCGQKQVFLPWRGFNGRTGHVYPIPQEAFDLVTLFHPAPHLLRKGGQTLMARNAQQVLGPELDDPTKLVICWTPGGKGGGGTGQAIRIAKSHNIPVLELFGKSLKQIEDEINFVQRNQGDKT